MKATLEFNLPEEQTEFENALNGSRYRGVLFHLRERLQQLDKGDKKTWTHDRMWEELRTCAEGQGLDVLEL